jgi:hypothetical protein
MYSRLRVILVLSARLEETPVAIVTNIARATILEFIFTVTPIN